MKRAITAIGRRRSECCEHFDKEIVGTILKSFKKPKDVQDIGLP